MLLEKETKTSRRWGDEYTPDSDLAQSTHAFPIIQNDTVEERLREKGSWRKGWGIIYGTPPVFFMYARIVSTHSNRQ